jgi:hypothetical protein
MCKVYNTIGSLTAIKSHLRLHDVNDFNSVNQLIDFQKGYSATRQQIISQHTLLIEQEKNTLAEEIPQLNALIQERRSEVEQQTQSELEKLKQQLNSVSPAHSNAFQAFIGFIKKSVIKRNIRKTGLALNSRIAGAVQRSAIALTQKIDRYDYIISHFNDAVNASGMIQLQELQRKKSVVDKINSFIYGAIGEQKVVKELEHLSDDHVLINDFACSFYPAIYNRQENDYIKSVQIDHLLISPAGIFLIETKNWSEHSLRDLNLRSPVQQIKRTNFALFKILAGEITKSHLALDRHHWGDRKIPVKNCIVLINQKPIEAFQYVKVLTLHELPGYIKCFSPIFSEKEIQMIADCLIDLNGQTIETRKTRRW